MPGEQPRGSTHLHLITRINGEKMGRKIGGKNKPKNDKPNITLKTIRLTASQPFHPQLKAFRLMLGLKGVEMAKRMDMHHSNLYHFETQNESNGYKNPYHSDTNTLTETAIKYAKALGATKIEIII
jgi:DNA-binding XRE family transcriptional regulator